MCWCRERRRYAARSLALLSGTCPHRSGVRKQGQNKTSAFGQTCPQLTMKAGYHSLAPELCLFFSKGTGPQHEPAALMTVGRATIGLMARLLWG